MKILLLGANGQVGWELRRSLSPLGLLIALDRTSKNYCGDLTNLEGMARTVHDVQPDLLVNAAAYTAVDKAESDEVQARLINAEAPGVIAKAANSVGAWMIQYSTDYVFDGSGSVPWKETDAAGPLSVYGRTKLEGEQLIAQHCANHMVIRTSWVYAARGGNFAKTMLRLAGQRDRLSVVDDQFGAPTGADLLADVTAHLARGALLKTGPDVGGIYHLAAGGETSWHGYACYVLACAQKAGMSLKAGPESIDAVPSSAFPAPAVRPKNSRLNTAKLQSTFDLELPDWQTGVARMLAEIT